MDYYYTNRQSATQQQGRKFGFPSGMFQRYKSQFGVEPNSYDMLPRTTTGYAGYTGCTDLMCEPRVQEPPAISAAAAGGGWAGPTRTGLARQGTLSPDRSYLGDGGLAGMGMGMGMPGQSMTRPKTMPVSGGGSYSGKSGNVIDSREAVKKYGGQFIFR